MSHFEPFCTRVSGFVEIIACFWKFSCYLGVGVVKNQLLGI